MKVCLDSLTPITNCNCNNDQCGCNVVEIDDLIVPTILELNKKGYKTRFCCSGHMYSISSIHIMFEGYLEDVVKNNLPEGFIFVESNLNSFIIRHEFVESDRYEELLKYNNILYKWSLGLKTYERND